MMIVQQFSVMDLVAISVQFIIGFFCLVLPVGGREYCWETFNATCPDGEVVLMQSARYGRMKLGRCLKVERVMDCYNDVMPEMNRLCSGRRYCELDIPDTSLHLKQPCPKDLMAYLEASYTCVKVSQAEQPNGNVRHCRQDERLALTSQSGYISNLVTLEDGRGSAKCPWSIEVPKGQQINITLLDFSVNSRIPVDSSMCNIYVNIREISSPDKSNSPVVPVCGGDTREKRVYLSEGNHVEIEIVTTPVQEEQAAVHFLLKYEVVGCPDLTPPTHGWVHRQRELAAVKCNSSGETWNLVCDGTQWVGDFLNCTPLVEKSEKGFPLGLVVAVGIGLILGILIGACLLAIVIHCQKRYRQTVNRNYTTQVIKEAEKTRVLKSSEYGYAHVWELQQLRTHPEGCMPAARGSQKDAAAEHVPAAAMFPTDYTMHSTRCPYSRHNREHTYECPQVLKGGDRRIQQSFSSPFHHDFEGIEHAGRSQSMTESSTQPSSSEEARYTN